MHQVFFGELSLAGDVADGVGPLTIAVAGPLSSPRPQTQRADVDANTLATLNAFAHRTYAPATEASRLKGAGAGLSDND